jgi:hypothetical protein
MGWKDVPNSVLNISALRLPLEAQTGSRRIVGCGEISAGLMSGRNPLLPIKIQLEASNTQSPADVMFHEIFGTNRAIAI